MEKEIEETKNMMIEERIIQEAEDLQGFKKLLNFIK